MSPTLKTLCSGHGFGSANTSPRNPSRGVWTTAELTKRPGTSARPAEERAEGSTGMTPALAAIATRFMAPPAPIRSTPGHRRFATTNPPTRAYESKWAAPWRDGEPGTG